MKTFAVLMLFSASLAAGPAAARTNWQGEAFIVAVNGSICTDDGWGVGSNFLVTYLPANIDNNGTSSFLALHGNRRHATSFRVSGGFAGGKAYSAVAIGSAGQFFTYTGSFTAFSRSPSTVTVTTNTIAFTTSIANFAGNSGCTVTLRGAMTLRP